MGAEDDDLLDVLTRHEPFGPPSADEFSSRAIARRLYIANNEIDDAIRASSPVFMVGRRGSGKTAVLRATFPRDELDVFINAAIMINEVADAIVALDLQKKAAPNELVVPLWQAVFTVALCARVHHPYCKISYSECPDAFEFGRVDTPSTAGPATDAASLFMQAVRDGSSRLKGSNTLRFLDTIELNGVTLHRARSDLDRAARKRGCAAVVSVDSLDQYGDLLWASGFLMTAPAQALQSLFRVAARTGASPTSIYKIRIAFPGELWHFYKELSENPLKDFQSVVVLHWDGKELLRMAAARLAIFLELHVPDEFRSLNYAGFGSSESAAEALLSRYLPKNVENRLGGEETTFAYLLRHTQLLPRHFLYLLNEIFRDQTFREGSIKASHVVDAVQTAEQTVAETIIDAFRVPYQHLAPICERLVRHLNMRFSHGELYRRVNLVDRGGMTSTEVMRMLIETGIVGRVTGIETRYVSAEFEYCSESRIFVTEDDELCLHPVFATRFGSKATIDPTNEANRRPIYPNGTRHRTDKIRNGGIMLSGGAGA